MRTQMLTSTDAFVVVDLDEAPAAGVARLAPKVLVDSATLLARSVTYAFALFGVCRSGASAGINATPDQRAAAVEAFVAELAEEVTAGRLALAPGLGLGADDLAGLGTVAPDPALAGWGAVVAAAAAGGALDGRQVNVVGTGPEVDAAVSAATEAGATVGRDPVDTACDVVLVAGRIGAVGYEAAATVRAGMLVPLTAAAVTARALAVLERAGTTVLPDFLAIAAPLLAAYDGAGGDPLERVAETARQVGPAAPGYWLAAAERAEGFLSSWHPELPFGRPLA